MKTQKIEGGHKKRDSLIAGLFQAAHRKEGEETSRNPVRTALFQMMEQYKNACIQEQKFPQLYAQQIQEIAKIDFQAGIILASNLSQHLRQVI